jgi:hypothetical protein
MSSTDPPGVLTLFATCPLPGCSYLTSSPGEPCDDCTEAFGGDSLIRLRRGQPMTNDEIAERDGGVRAAYAARLLVVEPVDGLERKRNQTCWLCTARRTCTNVPFGPGAQPRWECDDCRVLS